MKMQLMLITVMLMLALMMLYMKHPLSMGITLIMQTITACLTMSTFLKSTWLSYVLFLVFLGGMLVLFIYTTSLTPNEMFKMSTKMMIMSVTLMLLCLFMLMMMDPLLTPSMLQNMDTYTTWSSTPPLPGMKLYNESIMMMTTMTVVYLFITLISIVKITSLSHGPLKMIK